MSPIDLFSFLPVCFHFASRTNRSMRELVHAHFHLRQQKCKQRTTRGRRKPVSAYTPILLLDSTDSKLRTAQAAIQTVIDATLMEGQRSVQILQQLPSSSTTVAGCGLQQRRAGQCQIWKGKGAGDRALDWPLFRSGKIADHSCKLVHLTMLQSDL